MYQVQGFKSNYPFLFSKQRNLILLSFKTVILPYRKFTRMSAGSTNRPFPTFVLYMILTYCPTLICTNMFFLLEREQSFLYNLKSVIFYIGYHNWFRPTVLRWLQMSRGRTIQLLSAAVKLDKVERLDDIVKHSSSAVDAIGCLNSISIFIIDF